MQSTVPQGSIGLKRQSHALESGQYNRRGNCMLFLLTDRSMMRVLWRRRQQRSATTNCRYFRSTSQFLAEHSHSERYQVRTMAATHCSCGFPQSLHTNADSVNVLNTTVTISWRLYTCPASGNFTYVLICLVYLFYLINRFI